MTLPSSVSQLGVVADSFPSYALLLSSDPGAGTRMNRVTAEMRELVAARWEPCRVLLTRDHALVGVDQVNGVESVVFARVAEYSPPGDRTANPTQEQSARLDDGTVLMWRRTQACGCGSRLRGWSARAEMLRRVREAHGGV